MFEIPKGSKMYFGDVAKYKRSIEISALKVFYTHDIEEITTPMFSYLKKENEGLEHILKLSGEKNQTLGIRHDNTLDVLKILTNRINTNNKKWFYIQPVFSYPSVEHYQAGIEYIDEENIDFVLNIAIEFCKEINIKPHLLISNINIPLKISKELDIPLEIFKNTNIEVLLNTQYDWVSKLVYAKSRKDIENIKVPHFLKDEIEKLLSHNISYPNLVYSPIYFSELNYYNGIYFKFFDKNSVLICGGNYNIEGINGSGFAIYIDQIISVYCR